MTKLTLIKQARELVKHHNYDGPQLREAIPYINKFEGKQFVLKIGGSVLNENEWEPLIDDVVFLKKVGVDVVLVHGGSRQLDKAMKKKGLVPKKVDGKRVTSSDVLHLAAKVFSEISEKLGKRIKESGFEYVAFGRDSGLVQSVSSGDEKLGYVGMPKRINKRLLENLASNVVPIVSSVTSGTSVSDIGFNVNADDVAGYIASELKAEKLILMTDVDGVKDDKGNLLSSLTVAEVKDLISKGVINGGMIPKVNTCLNALNKGVEKCHIIKGGADAFINEILTDKGVGTEIIHDFIEVSKKKSAA